MSGWLDRCHFGDVRAVLRQMIADGVKVNTIVTSPPYWGLRDYGHAGQIGLEATPDEYVANMVEVFRLCREVLADDGTLWLNLGDTYATGAGKVNTAPGGGVQGERWSGIRGTDKMPAMGPITQPNRMPLPGLKSKDLVGIPWMTAFALRTEGWYLRQGIVWSKPNPMPESVRDRCTKSHEDIFLMSKSERYYFDQDAIAEPVAYSSIQRLAQDVESQQGSLRVPGKTNGPMKAVHGSIEARKARASNESKSAPTDERNGIRGRGGKSAFRGQGHFRESDAGPANREGREMRDIGVGDMRNKRSVWTVSTKPYKGAHFATFPPDLIEPCILAGAAGGGIVLDPFFGSGTTGQVAQALGRRFIGIELNSEYKALQDERLRQPSLALDIA